MAQEAKLPLAAAALALRMAPDAVSLDAPVAGGESELIDLLPALQPSPMERLERRDHLNRIDTQLQHLPPRDRTVLRLRYGHAQRTKLSAVAMPWAAAVSGLARSRSGHCCACVCAW